LGHGGNILATTKPVQPETQVENIIAILESFLEQAGMPVSEK